MPNYIDFLRPAEAKRIATLDAMKADIFAERATIANRAKQRAWRMEQAKKGK